MSPRDNQDPDDETIKMVGMPLDSFKAMRRTLMRSFYEALGCGALLGGAIVGITLTDSAALYGIAGAALGYLSFVGMHVGRLTSGMQFVITGVEDLE